MFSSDKGCTMYMFSSAEGCTVCMFSSTEDCTVYMFFSTEGCSLYMAPTAVLYVLSLTGGNTFNLSFCSKLKSENLKFCKFC